MDNLYNFIFDPIKNRELILERGIGFERVISELAANKIVDIVEHHNREKYGSQKVLILEIDGYIYAVPFIQQGNVCF